MGNFEELVNRELPNLRLLCGESMSRHTTFRIGGAADYYAVPDERELAPLLRLAKEASVPVTVIGHGSNLLVGDRGIRGLVIEVGERMQEVSVDGKRLVAQAGALLSKVAQTAAAAGLGGLEFAAGIPGNLGGAIVMNAGAYGGEMKDVIERVTLLGESGELYELLNEELDFGYRHSRIMEGTDIVMSATFLLAERPQEEIRAQMAQLRERRIEKQPLEYPSAGSTFKRPQGYFAGKLIMDAGLSGYTVGGAQVSEKHCGFVINRGNASARDVQTLMEDVQARVLEQFGVRLEPEVRMVGEFVPKT